MTVRFERALRATPIDIATSSAVAFHAILTAASEALGARHPKVEPIAAATTRVADLVGTALEVEMPWRDMELVVRIFHAYALKRDEYLSNGWDIDLPAVVESPSGWRSFAKRLTPAEVAGLEAPFGGG